MEPVNRLSINYRGESIELVSWIIDHGVELQDVKDMIRLEYRRRHHIPAGLESLEDDYETSSTYFGTYANGTLLAASRLIESEKLPTESVYYSFEPPAPLKGYPHRLLREVSRLTAIMRPGDNPFPRHFVSTTMISSLIDYGFKLGLCGGVSTIKISFMRLFERLNLPVLHEIVDARLIYPHNAVLSGFFYDQADPPVPVYYLHDEAKALFDGVLKNSIRTGTTLLGEPLRIISHEVLV